MKNKLRRDIFVIIFLLLVACIALAVPLAFSNPRWLLAPALLVVFALVVAVLGIRRLRRFVADMFSAVSVFKNASTPVCVTVRSDDSLTSFKGIRFTWHCKPPIRRASSRACSGLLLRPSMSAYSNTTRRPVCRT